MFIKIFDSTSKSEGRYVIHVLVWIILFIMMIFSCIFYSPLNIIILFFFVNEENYFVHKYFFFCINTPVHKYLGSLPLAE